MYKQAGGARVIAKDPILHIKIAFICALHLSRFAICGLLGILNLSNKR
jgi:hypothetical protein